jgi:hypothetical protein
MFAQFLPRLAAGRRHTSLWQYLLRAVLIGGALFVQSCAPIPPAPFSGADPSDPAIRVPPVSYRPVLSGYVSQRPVAPAPWRQQNERVAPAPKSGQ